jgi:hypothetical protein
LSTNRKSWPPAFAVACASRSWLRLTHRGPAHPNAPAVSFHSMT